jgi:hypothetical protein
MDNDGRVDPHLFKNISSIVRKEILCNYRNILYVYSATWVSIDQINGIPVLKTRKRNAPSLIYGSYSIVTIKLLQEWINNIGEFVGSIKFKLAYQ